MHTYMIIPMYVYDINVPYECSFVYDRTYEDV